MTRNPSQLVGWLVSLAMPWFLGFTTITLVVGPAYPRWEYGRPEFPPDPYGFTQEQRLELALVAVDYLERWAPADEVIFLLEEQRLPGSDVPLYNQAEIRHMVDVKNLTDAIRLLAWISGAVVLGGLAWLVARPPTRRRGFRALTRGGLITTLLLLGIGLFILVAWPIFFVQFHELLFDPGTWTFALSDSLIRLFPEQFWLDAGILMSGGTLLAGLIVLAAGRWALRGDMGVDLQSEIDGADGISSRVSEIGDRATMEEPGN